MTDSDNSAICQKLMQRAGRGDLAAFAELYDRTSQAVFGLASSILADAVTAEEVTREVYLQAWRTATRYGPDRGDVVTLLMIMTLHYALELLKIKNSSESKLTSPT